MSGIIHFESFVLAALIIVITPGSDTIFILARSLGQGRKAGVISALGISTGSFIHTLMAAFGLSIVIAKSIFVFNLIKYAGALYLFYLGFQMLLDKSRLNTDMVLEKEAVNYQKIYREAIINNILNPKVALFFIAFLPQFIIPSMKNTVLPFIVLGLTFIAMGIVWCINLAIFASAIFDRLRADRRWANYFNKICGLTMVGLGIRMALSERK
jgi:RhtB (resistance to homoserine/threonine) family protein